MDEAKRFPMPGINVSDDLEVTLEQYACDLLKEFSKREIYDLGLSHLRDRDEFPEISEHVTRINNVYVVKPLTAYLMRVGVNEDDAVEQASFFIMIVLAPVHRTMIFGTAAPYGEFARHHSRKAAT